MISHLESPQWESPLTDVGKDVRNERMSDGWSVVWERGPRVYEQGAPGNAKQALRDQVAKRTDCSRPKAPRSPATSVLLRGLINKVPMVMGGAYALLPKRLLSKRRAGYCHY